MKKLISMLLILTMVLGMIPMAVFAEELYIEDLWIEDAEGNRGMTTVSGAAELFAKARYSDGTIADVSVEWSLSNSVVATIDRTIGSGVKVVGMQNGFADLRAFLTTDTGEYFEHAIYLEIVMPEKWVQIRQQDTGNAVQNGTVRMDGGGILSFNTSIRTSSGGTVGISDMTWTSSDSEIVTIMENGTIMGVSDGIAQVSVSCEGSDGATYTTSFTVKVGMAGHIYITVTDANGNEIPTGAVDCVYGQSVTLIAQILEGETVISNAVTWTSHNPDVATVVNGRVYGRNCGETIVAASYTDQNGTIVEYPIYVYVDELVAHSITAEYCKVYNAAGEEVTTALMGDVLTVVAEHPIPYYRFDYWSTTGTAVVDQWDQSTTTLVMGNSNLTVTGNHCTGSPEITSVTVTGIDIPRVGEEADFSAVVPSGVHYTVAAPEGTPDYYNGVAWLDQTDNVYLKPGDVFISGHKYTCYVGILPTDGYVLSVTETGTSNLNANVELYSSHGGIALNGMFADVPRYEYVRLVGAFPSLGSSTYLTWYTTPVETYQLNVTGGYALNEDGEVVTRAAAGEKISLFYEDPMGIRDFKYWQNNSSVEVIFEYDSNGNATFTMPESDVDIQAVFQPYPLEKVEFELNGFYVGGQAEGLEVLNNNTGVDLIYNDTDKNYTLYNDYLGDMGTAASGYLYGNTAYWLQLELLVADGYTMDQLMEDAITLKIGDQVYSATSVSHADNYMTVYFKLESAPTVTLYSILVGDGTALYNGVAVTEAPAGATIYLIPNDAQEGQTFNGWKDEYGNITIETDVDGMMYFVMPEGNVYVNMLTKGTIYYVYVDGIDYPTVGANPDFTATVDSDYGYDFYPMDGVTDTGICWHKQLDQLSSERLFADSVFEPGCTYTASAVLQALDGYYFATDEYGDVNALCYINGTQAEISYINDELNKYISIYIEYTLPQVYSITVEGGEAYAARGNEPVETPITSAAGGSYIKVVPTTEGAIFSHWEIVSGTIKISEDELYSEILYFGMPDEDVVIRAVYIEIPTLTLKNPTLAFEDEILYNVYYNISDISNVVEMGLVTFATRDAEGTVDNALEVIPGYVANNDGSYTVHSNGVPAKMLSDALFFKVYAKLSDGSYIYTDVAGYHAVAYANTVLNSSASAEAKALVVAMLNYGAAAQIYFDYKADSLMNAGLTEQQKALVQAYDPSMVQDVVKADAAKVGSFVMNGGYSDIHPTVSFEGAFAINYYFTPNQPLTDLVKLSFADTSNRTVFEQKQQVWESGGLKLTNDMASATSFMADYSNPVRFYKGSNLTIEYPAMTKLVVVCPTNAYAQVWANTNTDSNATVSVAQGDTGYVVTVTFAEPVDSFVLTNLAAQTRVTELRAFAEGSAPVMYYWDAATYASVDVLTAENATGTITMKSDGSSWYATVEGIAAKAIDETIYVAGFYNSNGVAYPTSVIAYSLGAYCKSVAAKGEAFGAATAVYGYYAKAYFAI